MAPKKGHTNNPNGRPKGIPNRTTKEAKELLEQILLGQVENIRDALDELKEKDVARFLDSCAKLFTYVLPKKTDITGIPPIQVKLPDIVIKTNGND